MIGRRFEHWAGWLDDRTGIPSAARRFLAEEIPASSGWRQVFGSVALFLFLIQAFTGILLGFNYAPTPGDAYNSLRYILTEVTGGRLIRALHHWGASLIIVVVVLHMVQVFLCGAYKKPREATWIAGVALFLVALAYGFTGYLLPWDNRAYWGTVVATQIAAQAPLAGPYLLRLMGGDGQVGVTTFARFYEVHVLILPALTVLFLTLHIALVRKHGVAPSPGDEQLPSKPFYPGQVFRDTVAIFFAFTVLFTLAVVAHVPLERVADPSDTSYTPRPEWYFLFLFQLLKLFAGPLEIVGSVLLPAFAVLTLILIPFIDRGRMVRVTKRVVACSFVFLAAAAWTGLTAAAVATTPSQKAFIDYSAPTEWLQAPPAQLSGVVYFRRENCSQCHLGPSLSHMSLNRDSAWMLRHFKQHAASRNGATLDDAELNSLLALFQNVDAKDAAALQTAPDFALQGAFVYQQHRCGSCHLVNSAGSPVGPPLNGLSSRRSRSWVEQHFVTPRVLSPETIMPPFQLSPDDLANLTTYLLSLEPR